MENKSKAAVNFTTVDGLPEIPVEGNVTLIRLAQKLLKPQEIKAAVEAGEKEHHELLHKRKDREKTENS